MGFLGSRHGTNGMPENDWLGSSSTLSGALEKRLQENDERKPGERQMLHWSNLLCASLQSGTPGLRSEEKQEGREEASQGNRSWGGQDREQRFAACSVTALIFLASPEFNPTSVLLKIHYFPYALVEKRPKMSTKDGKRWGVRGTKTKGSRSLIPVSPSFVRLSKTLKIISWYWLILIILKVAIPTF